MGGEVVEHDVDLQITRHRLVDVLEETKHVLAGVAVGKVDGHLAGRDVQGCEQVRDAVALVVVAQRLAAATFHRQHG